MHRPSVDQLYREHRGAIRAYVTRSYPGYCHGWGEDAVAHAFTVVVEQPALLDRAWEDGGVPRILGLLRMLAWRYARGLWRKISAMDWDLLPDFGSPAGQDTYVHAHRTFDRALHHAANAAGPRRYSQIRAAVLDKLDTGDSDIAVAARHGLPREYVNRAKRHVTAEVLAA
jgi:hypothetical protein